MIVIKLSINSPSFGLLRQTKNFDGIWEDFKFEINNDIKECDVWVVYSKGFKRSESVHVKTGKKILITGEIEEIYSYSKSFINQFDLVITQRKDIKHKNVIKLQPAQPWWVGRLNGFKAKNLEDFPLKFTDLEKKVDRKAKNLCVISSNKSFTKGHNERLKFVDKLQKAFGGDIDFYGKGFNDFDDKWDIQKEYKYQVVIENAAAVDYWTEKLADAFLAETFPFYHGAPNISDYFSLNSLKEIDISRPEESIKIIKKTISENYYEKNLEHIRQSKKRVLYEHNLIPLLKNFIESNINLDDTSGSGDFKIFHENTFFDIHKIPMILKRQYYNLWYK